MSTRRAKQRKRDVFFKVRARRRWKKFDQKGFVHKDIRQLTDRPYKFRKHAYDHEKKLEDGLYIKRFKQSLKGVIKNPGLLAYVERTYEDEH